MRWWSRLRAWWPFGVHCGSAEATEALQAAELSQVRALSDRRHAASTRVEAEQLAAQVRAHNTANRYNDWLQAVIHNRG